MPSANTDLLADLIRAKRSALAQVRDIGRKQFELIERGDMTALLDLLAVKQRIIDQLQRIEAALAPFRGQDPSERAWRSPEDRQRCSDEIEQCEALLREILGQERLSEGMLARRRDETAERLQDAGHAARARGAYALAAAPQRGLDLLCEG